MTQIYIHTYFQAKINLHANNNSKMSTLHNFAHRWQHFDLCWTKASKQQFSWIPIHLGRTNNKPQISLWSMRLKPSPHVKGAKKVNAQPKVVGSLRVYSGFLPQGKLTGWVR